MFSMSLQAEETQPSLRTIQDPAYDEAIALARTRVTQKMQPPAVTAVGGTAPWKSGEHTWDGHHFKVDIGKHPFTTLVVYLPGTTCEAMAPTLIKWLTDHGCVVVQPLLNQLHKVSKRGKSFKARREIYVCMYTIIYVYITRCRCKLFRVRLPCVLSLCVFLVWFP